VNRRSDKAVPVLALDGPSGSGKGTIGQLCADRLGWHYLDSGALYRALAWLSSTAGIPEEDEDSLLKLIQDLDLVCRPNVSNGVADTAGIEINGQLLTTELRTENIGKMASILAPKPAIRLGLLDFQRRQERPPGLVADGRDMGTVVFPDAAVKIFLTASVAVRAKRRYKQLKDKGLGGNLARLSKAIQERDARDSSRSVSPLVAASDAEILDTSDLSIDEVVSLILDFVKQKLSSGRAGRD
jgi:cytidylate kinase